ncbi:MAG TPA: NmrA family NAD(P)-binding protein [Gemmatimonadota bacterium]|nr:NmrA family NAD(P)-binding protein [Gemmatimonadota bacterium]
MRILVIGGTGTVGRELVARLRKRDVRIRVLTRSPEKHREEGVEFVKGDLERADTLAPAFAGADRVYLLTPLHPKEAELGLAAIRAAVEAEVERIVVQTVHQAEAAPYIPHFASKLEMVQAVVETGIPWVDLAPNSFFQNDLRYRVALVDHGVYPQPIGSLGANRVDVRDIAEVATALLLDDGREGRTIPVAGPDPLTGESTAEIWSDRLGRPVRYIGDDLEAWSSQVRGLMPDWLVGDLVMMYRLFQEHGLVASEAELDQVRDILGREPRSFDDFATETAARWKSEG